MKRCRSRLLLLSVVACLTACATARVPEEKSPLGTTGIPPPLPPLLVPQPTSTPPPQAAAAAPAPTFEGRLIATELPPEVKRLIDGVRSLHEKPGLILDREAIYETLGVKPISSKSWQDGGRSMEERLNFERPQEYAAWKATLKYSEFPKSESWSVKVELSYIHGPNCYPSRLVESYWGKQFAYRPFGTHAFLGELLRKQRDMPPTGPHDGVPYNAGFFSATPDSANVSFDVGLGSCLDSIRASKLFKFKEYRDDHIYHQ